jgi:hypothetical protein
MSQRNKLFRIIILLCLWKCLWKTQAKTIWEFSPFILYRTYTTPSIYGCCVHKKRRGVFPLTAHHSSRKIVRNYIQSGLYKSRSSPIKCGFRCNREAHKGSGRSLTSAQVFFALLALFVLRVSPEASPTLNKQTT